MLRSQTTSSRPALSSPDGSRMPLYLALVHEALMRAPSRIHAQLSRLVSKTMQFRLPSMRANYPDGRCFQIPAGDAMYAQVFIHGAYEPAESAVTTAILRRDDFVIDIGANYGWYSLLMASAVGAGGRVWAIEPVPPMLERLRANLALNPGAPVDVKPFALGEEAGAANLHLFEGLVHGHASMSALGRSDFVEHETSVQVLDQLLEDEERAPALIKLDVEGAELSVLRGARRCLDADDAPIWMIEVNAETAAAFGYRPADLLAELEAVRDHQIFRVGDEGLVREYSPAHAPHGTTWVCVPEGRSDRVAGLTV